jgi:hypothetical protein
MRILLSFCLLLAIAPWARADVRREGEVWVLEDSQLKVTVGAENAHLIVLDKVSDTLWQQEDKEAATDLAREKPMFDAIGVRLALVHMGEERAAAKRPSFGR